MPPRTGRYSSTFGLASESQCVVAEAGFYAPAGSTRPITCPGWGICGGGGGIPDDVIAGQQVQQSVATEQVEVEQEVIEQTLELGTSDPAAVNETALRHQLAVLYDLPLETITLTLSADERRQLTAIIAVVDETERETHHRRLDGLLRYLVRIDPQLVASSGSTGIAPAAPTSASSTAALASRLRAAWSSAGGAGQLASALGGISISQSAEIRVDIQRYNTTQNVTRYEQVKCPLGTYGADGRCVLCPAGASRIHKTTPV